MLGAHPQVVSPPECGFIQWNFPKFEQADFTLPTTQADFARAVLSSKKMETWGLTFEALQAAFSKVAHPSYATLSEAVFYAYASHLGKDHVRHAVDKNNYYIGHLDTLFAAIPAASYLHLVRDVRDVACSYLDLESDAHQGAYAPKLTTDLAEIGREWNEANLRVHHFLSDKKHHVVRYEDLLTQPEATLRGVFDFLQLPFHPQVLEYYRFNDEPEETMGWKKRTLNPVDPSRAGQFTHRLSAQQQQTLIDQAREALQIYNYL